MKFAVIVYWVLIGTAVMFGQSMTLTVAHGSGGGTYPVGRIVQIWADPAPTGQVFDRWTGGTAQLVNAFSWHTSLVAQAGTAALAATFKRVPAYQAAADTINGSNYSYYVPQPHSGVVIRLHGTGGNGASLFQRPDGSTFADQLVTAGYGVISPDSSNRQAKQWDARTPAPTNPDLKNLNGILQALIASGLVSAKDPIFVQGESNGGGAAGVYAPNLQAKAEAVYISSAEAGINTLDSTVPTLFGLQQNDGLLGDAAGIGYAGLTTAQANYQVLRGRNVNAELYINPPSPLHAERFALISGISIADSRLIYRAYQDAGLIDAAGAVLNDPFLGAYQKALPAAYSKAYNEIEAQLRQCFTEHSFYNELDLLTISFFNQQIGMPRIAPPLAPPPGLISAASYFGRNLAPDSIAALFGTNFPEDATVTVVDNAGVEKSAKVYLAAPTQINFVIPAGTAPGTGKVIVRSGGATVQTIPAQFYPVAPGWFSANGDGRGAPAGSLLRIRTDGTRSLEPLAQFDQGRGTYLPATINFGPTTDALYLTLYGTGIRNRAALSDLTVIVGGIPVKALFAGSQPEYPGLDQINIPLPRSIAGSGIVGIFATIDGQYSNRIDIGTGTVR